MKTLPVKVSELSGPALHWGVAKCEGWPMDQWYAEDELPMVRDDEVPEWEPSTNWNQGGPIIEREEISLEFNRAGFMSPWIAYKLGLPDEDDPQGGSTPLIAAMRCYVASKFGDTIEIPEELLA